jgi:homoserine O-succinyltransferase
MPLIIEGGRVPKRWAARKTSAAALVDRARPDECVRLALINNMPDSALEDTEMQFFELLDGASGEVSVFLKLYSLTGVPRTERGQQHLADFYFGVDDLWNSRFDAVIMTGTEPRQPDLRNEPYWPTLAKTLDWAEENTVSSILSCLAAHASVLHSDGIPRHPLGDKQFGVFAFEKTGAHPLTLDTAEQIRFPHSRWNEVRAEELQASGYRVLSHASDGGVDTFVKHKKRSLFVHFQGHPEYGAETLLKEYRRDVKRFLRKERETYPTAPQGYFGTASAKLVDAFREIALADRREEILGSFPDAALLATLQKTWHSSATAVYRNWLGYVISKTAETLQYSAVAPLPEIEIVGSRKETICPR